MLLQARAVPAHCWFSSGHAGAGMAGGVGLLWGPAPLPCSGPAAKALPARCCPRASGLGDKGVAQID